MKEAYVWVDQVSGVVKIRTPYVKEFVDRLKWSIPRDSRSWKPQEKVWEIEPSYADILVDVASDFFTVKKHDQISSIVPVQEPDIYSQMLSLASIDSLKRIYRIIAMDVHPDRGGNDQAMTILNECWEKIKKERQMT